MGRWKSVLGLVALATAMSVWQNHTHDYRKRPPTVLIVGAARESLNAAYAEYQHQDSAAPFFEQGFCARSWETRRPTWKTTVVVIADVVRSEANASPIGVSIACRSVASTGAGIVFHTHPPQQCVVAGNWKSWSACVATTDTIGLCRGSWFDFADTLIHRDVPARFVVCGRNRFVLYHATDAL